MPTLTIELSDEEYQAALNLPQSEQRRALSLAANRYATALNQARDEEPISKVDLEAIGEGLADLDAGRVVDGDDFFASLEEKHGWKL